MNANKLQAFRQAAYNYLGKAKDATFELIDALLVTRNISCLAELSLCPLFRRKWPSVYEALEDCRPQREKLMQLYIEQMLDTEEPVLAIDHTSWPRSNAVTLQERTYEHQPISTHPLARPITIGQGYSTIAWIPQSEGSWALPLRHERITSWESPISKACWQIKLVCRRLKERPLVLGDSEYGCVPFLKGTSDINADFLLRLRPNRCLYGAPSTYSGKGRPRLHGDKFKLSDSTTWSNAQETIEIYDENLGKLKISRWDNLHFYSYPERELSVFQVTSLEPTKTGVVLPPMWLAWVGKSKPSLNAVRCLYLRRFSLDHWYRFAKQRLHWTVPKLSTPKQCERWSDLMPLATWQLWLARDLVADYHLPWQKPLPKLTLLPGSSINQYTFGYYWYANCCAETPWKV